jgi:hypothetical protein
MSDLELGLKQLNYYGYRMTAYSHFSRCELPGLWDMHRSEAHGNGKYDALT